MADRRVVHRVEEGDDRHDIEATTYQMRNPFKQMRDGFFTSLDVFNYLHHHWIAKQARKDDWVLDVCCGRGIMLPLLRYHASEIAGYVGVDIEPANAEWLTRRVTDGKHLDEMPRTGHPGETYTRDTYYPFPVFFVESNAAEMTEPVREELDLTLVPPLFNLIIYTQSIEHMHPHAGWASLNRCAELAAPGCRLILSGPNTPEGQDGYDARYRAHVYEWKRQELLDALQATGWRVQRQWGLTLSRKHAEQLMADSALATVWDVLSRSVPSEWLLPVLAPLFPEACDEIAIQAVREDQLTLT
jgi:SAM-dependent methyltransferase